MPSNQGTPWFLAAEFILMSIALLAPWATPGLQAQATLQTASPAQVQRPAPTPSPSPNPSTLPASAEAQAVLDAGDGALPVARASTPPPAMHPLHVVPPQGWPSQPGRLSGFFGLHGFHGLRA